MGSLPPVPGMTTWYVTKRTYVRHARTGNGPLFICGKAVSHDYTACQRTPSGSLDGNSIFTSPCPVCKAAVTELWATAIV